MEITINSDSLGPKAKQALSMGWGIHAFNLAAFDTSARKKLREVLSLDPEIPYNKRLLKSLDTYEASLVLTGNENAPLRARSIPAAINALRAFFRSLPSRRLYRRVTVGDTETWNGVLVTEIRFHKAQRDRAFFKPAYLTVRGISVSYDGVSTTTVGSATLEALRGKRPTELLAGFGYSVETPELKAEMINTRKRWIETRRAIGKQFRATGFGTLGGVDGNVRVAELQDRESSYSWQRYHDPAPVQIDKDGPGQVVIDLSNEKHTTTEITLDLEQVNMSYFSDVVKPTVKDIDAIERLKKFDPKKKRNDDDDEEDDEDELDVENENDDFDEDGEALDAPESVFGLRSADTAFIDEIPVVPVLTVFDLRKHMRYRVDLRQLSEYVYDVSLRDKLVIDPASRMLIEMLIYQRQEFKDVIAKKGGGATILCAGPPGVGKTLTAEVFSEVEKRPLYSVQCSQLGTTAEELEGELERCFARARRWGAILLLDEADVYIAQRGANMEQNAIVGVFLRMLEYYNGVLFMTTNRADSVDDAILSRCVARIDYDNPSPPEQVRIWNILAQQAGLSLGAGVAEEIARKYRLSGRDVKQLLKLAGLVSFARKLAAIDVATIEFCMRYKPAHRVEAAAPRPMLMGNK